MARFSDRTKRLARRQESDAFRLYVMPISWIVSLVGLACLVGLWASDGLEKMHVAPAFPVFCGLFAAPAITALLRFVRGHFYSVVRDV